MNDKEFLEFIENIKNTECPHCPNLTLCVEELCYKIAEYAKKNYGDKK